MTYAEIIQKAVEAHLNESVLSVTADDLMVMRNHVTQWNLPADHLVLSVDLSSKFFSASWFASALEPATKEEAKEGLIGTLFGMKVIRDTKNTMEPGSVAAVSAYGLEEGQPEQRCVFKCTMV